MIRYKDVFKNALKDKYTIQFDNYNTNDIIIINNEIKCKYSLLFITKNVSKNLFLLIWNDSNVYSDETSKNISKNIRDFFLKDKKYLLNINNQLIYENDLENLIKSIIQNNKKINNINTIWIVNNSENSINKFYLITEIINF
jgi:hypothetical protein